MGSTDRNDDRSSFSNYGACVDLYAPGSNVTSTLPGGRVGLMSGTSMAAPVVSGAAALYMETHPDATLPEVKAALLRNAVGQKHVVPAVRLLMVHVHDRNGTRGASAPPQ